MTPNDRGSLHEGVITLKNARLIAERESRNMTQLELARAIGITQSMIAHIEAGRRAPSWKFRIRLARLFSVPVELLFFDSDDDHKALSGDEVVST